MAAYFAKLNYPENRVILFEKNKYLGAKVIISGGGRCNVTTGISEVSEVLKNYPRGSDFLRTAMQAFPPEGVKSWFESQGVALKTEDDLRVFPVSDNGKDVVGALEDALKELEVEIHCDAHVTEITPIENSAQKFQINLKSGETFQVHKLILTTGGNAYRHTGSTGDGYAFAQALGHSITALAPSLSSFYIAEKWIGELSGISFPKTKFTFLPSELSKPEVQITEEKPGKKSQKNLERTGPFLFTHKGVSGPAVFALSGMAAYQNFSAEKPAKLLIDFFPDSDAQQIEQKLLENFSANPAKKLLNVLSFIVPHRLAEKLLDHTTESLKLKFPASQINCSEVSKVLRQHLVKQLKSLEIHIVGRGAGDEFVTAGGVPLSEINPKTMESRLTPGLYFAGELMDVDGFTGGFNLQASWASGALAGESAGTPN